MIHTVKGFNIVNEVEIDVFLEFSGFFYELKDLGNLISGSFTFLKSNLYIWEFLVHILVKPRLENFEHYFANVWNECNCAVVWTFFGNALLWIGMKLTFSSPVANDDFFQSCWHIECVALTASSFRIWNTLAGIPGEGNGNLLQYSCLENPIDGESW